MGPYRFFDGSGPKFFCRVNGVNGLLHRKPGAPFSRIEFLYFETKAATKELMIYGHFWESNYVHA